MISLSDDLASPNYFYITFIRVSSNSLEGQQIGSRSSKCAKRLVTAMARFYQFDNYPTVMRQQCAEGQRPVTPNAHLSHSFQLNFLVKRCYGSDNNCHEEKSFFERLYNKHVTRKRILKETPEEKIAQLII